MTITDILYLIGTPTILSAVIITFLNRKMAQTSRLAEQRSKARREENYLIMQGIMTTGDLSVAVAEALREGHINGNVTAATEKYCKYRVDLSCYLLRQNANTNN